MTMKNRSYAFFLQVFLLLLPVGASYCVHIPDVLYFPVVPNYSESLVSDKSNAIDISLKIEIPRTSETIDKFILNWLVIMKLSNEKFIYSIRMFLLTNGNIYLSEMRDGAYERTFPSMPDILPSAPVFNKTFEIGENMSFKLIKYYNKFSDPFMDKSYYNVISGELKLLDQACQIFFSKDNGIIMIKTGEETFLVR